MAKRKEEVTPKQKEVWDFIVGHVERMGFQPSIAEIAESLGIGKRAVRDRIAQLISKGVIAFSGEGKDRSLVLRHVRFEAKFVEEDDR